LFDVVSKIDPVNIRNNLEASMINYFVYVRRTHSYVAESIGQLLGPEFNEKVRENCVSKKRRGTAESKISVVQVTLEQARQILAKWPDSVKFYREQKEGKANGAGRLTLIEVNKKDLSGQNQRLRDMTQKMKKVKNA
jgi:hypothetical protein